MRNLGPIQEEAVKILYDFYLEGRDFIKTNEMKIRTFKNITAKTLHSLKKRSLVKKRSGTAPILFRVSNGDFKKIYYNPITEDYEPPLSTIPRSEIKKRFRPVYRWKLSDKGLQYAKNKYGIKGIDPLDLDEYTKGIAFDSNQPFGIELEFTIKNFKGIEEKDRITKWLPLAHILAKAIETIIGKPPKILMEAKKSDKKNWHVKYDGSCGWEITSPKFIGKKGLSQASNVIRSISKTIKETKLKVNYKTGFHLHFEFLNKNINEIRTLIRFIRYYEPALVTILPPSRLRNPYCKSFREEFIKNMIAQINNYDHFLNLIENQIQDKYVSVNMKPLLDIKNPRIEIRSHSGTYNWNKILHWICLWMGILKNGKKISKPDVPDNLSLPDKTPCGDIELLTTEIKLDEKNIAHFNIRKRGLSKKREEEYGNFADFFDLMSMK